MKDHGHDEAIRQHQRPDQLPAIDRKSIFKLLQNKTKSIRIEIEREMEEEVPGGLDLSRVLEQHVDERTHGEVVRGHHVPHLLVLRVHQALLGLAKAAQLDHQPVLDAPLLRRGEADTWNATRRVVSAPSPAMWGGAATLGRTLDEGNAERKHRAKDIARLIVGARDPPSANTGLAYMYT